MKIKPLDAPFKVVRLGAVFKISSIMLDRIAMSTKPAKKKPRPAKAARRSLDIKRKPASKGVRETVIARATRLL